MTAVVRMNFLLQNMNDKKGELKTDTNLNLKIARLGE